MSWSLETSESVPFLLGDRPISDEDGDKRLEPELEPELKPELNLESADNDPETDEEGDKLAADEL